jgi:serine/threonine protein kinase
MSASSESTVFGRYRLLELIAKGGMAEVFRAKTDGAAGTEKQMCIKRILPQLSSNSDFIKLFVSEARIVLPLTHGNITQVFDFGENDGLYFLAMEYVRGQNLAQVLKRVAEGGKTLDVAAALFISAEVCRGLQYAHSYTDGQGKSVVVVHRDVSPHNVLISYNGEVKLTDFGIARAASKAAESESVVRGKPCYVSPEQADGKGGDPRSDIFSMGSLLYEALTGVRPFEADTDGETLELVRRANVDAPSSLNPEISAELDAIVLKALARNPDDRYQRAGDLQVDLSGQLHQLAADFTAGTLATSVKELFAWELAQADGQATTTSRDRLLFQLSKAGIDVDDKSASTDELLQMGTVALDAKPAPAPGRGRTLAVIVALVVLLGAGVGVSLALRGDGGESKQDGGASAVALGKLPKFNPTEHITPKSLRKPLTVRTPASAPAPTPGTGSGAGTGSATAPHAKKGSGSRKPTARRQGHGYLNCNSWPWSLVYLNGKRLRGNTPLYRVKVSAGRHRLKFVNPELGLRKEVSVTVAPGNIKTVAVSLQQ